MRLAAAFLVAGLTLIAAHARAADILGSWYGEGEPDDVNQVWLARAFADGSMKITFRACHGLVPNIVNVEGRWKLTGTRMEIFMERANGQPVQVHDSYEILSNNGRTLRYKLTQSATAPASFIGYVFTSNKVTDDFQVPGCGIVS